MQRTKHMMCYHSLRMTFKFSFPTDASTAMKSEGNQLSVLNNATALAVSFAICKAATSLTKLLGIQGGDLPAITAIVVVLATSLPKYFCQLAPAGEAFAVVLMQVT